MSVYDQLKALNIELPPVGVPAAAYVPFAQSGKLLLLSGHIGPQAVRAGQAVRAVLAKPVQRDALARALHAALAGAADRSTPPTEAPHGAGMPP